MTGTGGLALAYPDGGRAPAAAAEINDALARYGARVWPLDLSNLPDDLRRLLGKSRLSASEHARVRERFLLPRERLLQLIVEAGRTPQVPGGGEMSTFDSTHGVEYPQLHLVVRGIDYSRFDRLHVNRAADGTGVDEVLQVLSGSGIRVVQSLPDLGLVTLYLDCPSARQGWIVTYSGGHPHIGSLTEATEGTKMLVQAIGPPAWSMNYLDDGERRPSAAQT
jgi:hypothetical protein